MFYRFSQDEVDTGPVEKLGGKGAGLAEMSLLHLPVPFGFTLPIYEGNLYWSTLAGMKWLEGKSRGKFGKDFKVSVRSGGAVSMPGMMDTILGVETWMTLHESISRVEESWNSERAVAYRKKNCISNKGGTAITIQLMVFGDKDNRSGTGVLFSRNPNTGEKFFGEFIPCARGEVLVGGERNTFPLTQLLNWDPKATVVVQQLREYSSLLERHIGDMVEIEFTIEEGILWLLQVRRGKRTDKAQFHILHDMFFEGLIGFEKLEELRSMEIFKDDVYKQASRNNPIPIAKGIGASPGVFYGRVCGKDDAPLLHPEFILFTDNTSPDDFPLLLKANAIITRKGGATCHAAVVARELKKPCVVGVGDETSLIGQEVTVNGETGEVFRGKEVFETELDGKFLSVLNNLKSIFLNNGS